MFGETYNILSNAAAALVTSGTATLETALFNVPQIVCYKGGNISYHIAMQLIKVNYISLVNLIVDREVVIELIQHELNNDRLEMELNRILFDEKIRERMFSDYKELKQKLGGEGASERTAKQMISYLLNKD